MNPTRTSEYLKRAMQIPYEKALKSHIAYYKKQFDRVRLTLPTGKTSQLETPKRIENFGKGKTWQWQLYFSIMDVIY